ncbi:hypothetical protein [Actinoplanes sp. NPDC089786]|uniref:hypothetical protein n=1 Tax=Actinoplanes sp. NPDC089786 TaxID=3155185 RepID=UPI00341B77CA
MKVRTPIMAALAAAVLLLAEQAASAQASPADAAFNSGTGALNVNYGSYLAKHDIVYNRPNSSPVQGLTAGTFADGTGVGLSRGQSDPNGFGYTFAATVEGAGFTSQTINGTRVRLSIAGASSCTVWFTAASRKNAAGGNSVQAARDQLSAVDG